MAKRPRAKMPNSERAKQFSSFKALSGLELALEEKRRELGYEEKKTLSEDEEHVINEALASLESGDRVKILFHNGKYYEEKTVTFETVDEMEGLFVCREAEIKLPLIAEIVRAEEE